jgi:AcrR family transcriptional regulator
MAAHSPLSGCARREPCQHRGEVRVAALLAAAIAEFSAVGYEAATMSSIAARARAPIGSLYQFFPNKQAIARAVRTRHIQDVEVLWTSVLPGKGPTSVRRFADRLAGAMIEFVNNHPAFLPLLDAPSSTLPSGPRDRLRKRLEGMLLLLHPRLAAPTVSRIAEMTLNINKTFLTMYAKSEPRERGWIVKEYRALLQTYLARHLPRGRLPPRSARIAPPSRKPPRAASPSV